jgi:hypothetical protein
MKNSDNGESKSKSPWGNSPSNQRNITDRDSSGGSRPNSPKLGQLKSIRMLSMSNADNKSNPNSSLSRRASSRFGPETKELSTAERIKLCPASL